MLPIILDARTATNHFPGIGRYVVNLARALHATQLDLEIILLRNPAAASRWKLPDLPTIECAASPFSLAQQWQVRRIVRSTRASLYHSPYYLMPYLPGAPAVLTCYDLIPLIFPHYFSASQRLIFHLTHWLALRTARITLAISESTKRDLVRFFRVEPQRIVVTPLAADAHFQPPSHAEIDRVRQTYALPDRYVLYFGSNKPHKNLPHLITALSQSAISIQHSAIQLVIAGHWDVRYPEARLLVEKLNLTDRVRFIGPVKDDDLPALYGGAEVFAFPSQYEGFGLPVLEAMACGAPVVCGNRSSLPEVARDAALLFDPADVTALALAIEQVISDRDLRSTLQASSLQRAAQFTWERTAQQTVEVYRRCL